MNPSEHTAIGRRPHDRPRRPKSAAEALACPFVLVVMEYGSAWPSHIDGGCSACVALTQAPGESRGDLLRRVYDRIRATERAGRSIDIAALRCKDDPDRGALEGRLPIARALLGAVLRGGSGRLDLIARSEAPARTRQSVVALAGALTEALIGSCASVSARFTEQPRPGAVRHGIES